MKQQFVQGVRIPVTHISTSDCYLIDIKPRGEAVWSLKLAFGITKKIKKPQQGELKKAGIDTPLRFLKEVEVKGGFELIEKNGKKGIKINDLELFIGDLLKPVNLFKKDDAVSVSGISKGKGFAGVVKRHKFAGGPRTHGQSDRERAPGAIGSTTTPGRVFKGKRMAGRMGGVKTTVKNLKVVDADEAELIIKGMIPGAKGSLVIIKN